MPFKSEKQRKYLWANEPEIARDWTDTYGSGIHKAKGGRIGFFQGAQAETREGKAMSPGTSADYSPGQGHREARETRGAPPGITTSPTHIPTQPTHRGEGINQRLNKIFSNRESTNLGMRYDALNKYLGEDPLRRLALIKQGLIDEDESWIGDITSAQSLEDLKKYIDYTGGYHDVNDPGHPNYDPRGGGEGEQPWLYPQGGIASVDDTITTVADLGLGSGHFRVPKQYRVAEGGRVPAAFGGIMDSETGRRGYGFGSFNPFKAVKKAVKSGIKGVKKLAKSKLGKMALAYLATAGASNYLAGQGWGLGSPAQDWSKMKWLDPRSVGTNVGTSWDKAASFLSPASKTVADKTVTTAGQGLPWYKDPWKVIPAASIASGYFADKMPADDIDDGTEKWDAEKAKWDRFYANLDDEDSYRVPEDLRAAQGGRIGRQEGGLMDLGGMEKDYREDGGFVPLGGEEKADDVPARLSRNEFVFTADAVRNAGGGDIDKGAEVMENVIKNLEAGGKVSEESQGQGAQEMFETSERLSEVI